MKKLFSLFLLTAFLAVGNVWAEEETITLSEQGYTNAQVVSSTEGSVVTLTYTDGGTATAYYNTGTGVRVYSGGKMTVTASDNTITQVVVTFAKNNSPTISWSSNGTSTSSTTDNPATWEGSATSVDFNVATKGHARIQSVAVTYTTSGISDPAVSASNVNIAYDATGGSIAYSVNNSVEGGAISADVTEGNWLTLGQGTDSPISFTCSANDGDARTATVTLTYTYNNTETVTKDVTVTQAAAPVIYTTMDQIFAAATAAGSTATSVNITLNNWVVTGVKSSNAYVTDGTKGFIIYQSGHGFAVGDVLSGTVSCKVQLYRAAAEITELTTSSTGISVTTGGIITPVTSVTIDNLSGINTGAVFSFENLSYDGTNFSDGVNTIKPYNTLYSYSIESGKTYNVTGVYLQYNATKEILPRSANDIEEVVNPTLTFATNPETAGTIAAVIDGEDNTITISSGDGIVAGTDLSISATANNGYTFTNWSAEGISLTQEELAESDLSIKMPASDVTLTANFSVNSYELDLTSAHGDLAVTVNGEAWTSGNIAYGSTVSITATAATNWAFSNWTVVGFEPESATANPLEFTMPASDVMIEAEYADASVNYNITYHIENASAIVQRTGGSALNLDEPVAINGFTFQGWSSTNDLNNLVFVDNSTIVSADMELYAIFGLAGETAYRKVTATGDITDGQYLIVYEGDATHDAVAFDGSLETLDASNNGVDVTINEGVIAYSDELAESEFTIDVTAGTILSASGYYIGKTAYANGLDSKTDVAYTNTFAITDGIAVITASGGCTLRYNYASDQLRFRYYKSGQKDIQLYKKSTGSVTYALYPAKIGKGGFGTYAADFAYTVSGATAYKAAYSAGVVTLTEITGVIPAGEGIILYGTEGNAVTITPSNESPAALADNDLVGVVTAETAPTGAYAIATLVDDGDEVATTKFYPCAGVTVPAHKAYLNTGAATAPSLRIVFAENNTTDIKNLDANENAVKFIENGKLYIRKNGVVYDATGAVVR